VWGRLIGFNSKGFIKAMAKNDVPALTLKPSDTEAAIDAMINTSRAMFLWGAPGISKSAVSQQVATKHKRAFIDLRLSQMDPTDLRGIPYPTVIGGVEGVRWQTPYVMPRDLDISLAIDVLSEETRVHFGNPIGSNDIHYCTLPRVEVKSIGAAPGVSAKIVINKGGKTTLVDHVVLGEDDSLDSVIVALIDKHGEFTSGKIRFLVTGKTYAILGLEEFNSAPPSVQAAAYQLVLDRRLGEYLVPDGVFIMGMGNRDTDRGVTFKMPTPVANRFVHIEMRQDFDDWQTWALRSGISAEVVGYLSAFKDQMFQFEAGTASRGFATPRSWHFLSDIIHANEDAADTVMLALFSGCVGDGTAIQFNEFRKVAKDLPKADDILSGKLLKMTKTVEVSLAFALTTTLCYELKERSDKFMYIGGKKNPDFKKHPDYTKWLLEADCFFAFMMKNFVPEICVMGARTAISIHRLPFDTVRNKEFAAFTAKFKQFLIVTHN
jgi:MoxR-like ATPase